MRYLRCSRVGRGRGAVCGDRHRRLRVSHEMVYVYMDATLQINIDAIATLTALTASFITAATEII